MVIKGVISSVRTFGLLVHIQQVLHYMNGQRIKDKQKHFGELHLLDIKVNLVNPFIDKRNYNIPKKKKKGLCYTAELTDERVTDSTKYLSKFKEGEILKGNQQYPHLFRIELTMLLTKGVIIQVSPETERILLSIKASRCPHRNFLVCVLSPPSPSSRFSSYLNCVVLCCRESVLHLFGMGTMKKGKNHTTLSCGMTIIPC